MGKVQTLEQSGLKCYYYNVDDMVKEAGVSHFSPRFHRAMFDTIIIKMEHV